MFIRRIQAERRVFPFNHFMRESYNTPDSVYATAKKRGMDLVTITDHDQISGALAIGRSRLTSSSVAK